MRAYAGLELKRASNKRWDIITAMTTNPADQRQSTRCGLLERLKVALGLLGGLRTHDFRAARTFIQTTSAELPLHVRLWRFAGWTFHQMFVIIPDALREVKFAQPVAKTPYWLASGNPQANYPWAKDPSAHLPDAVDTVVIGAGFTGASLAYFWAKRAAVDRTMVVLEMDDPASGASGRNAGTIVMGRYYSMIYGTVLTHLSEVRPDLNDEKRSKLADLFAAAYCRAAYKNADMMEQTVRSEGIDCDYARNGWVQVRTPDEQEWLNQTLHRASESGFDDWIRLTPAQVLEKSGLRVASDAGFSKRAGSFNPAKWVWALLDLALKSRKVNMFTQTKVLRVANEGEHYVIHTSRGAIRARYVVNATEAHSAALHRQLHNVIRPMQTQAAAGHGGPRCLQSNIAVSGGLWFGDRRGDHVLFGTDGTRVPDSCADQNKPSRFLSKFSLGELMAYTGSFAIEVTHEWSGTTGFTPDEYPIVGLLDAKRQYLIGGMCGSGTGVSFNAARCIVNRILGKTDEPDDYPPEYFAPSRLLDPQHHNWPRI